MAYSDPWERSTEKPKQYPAKEPMYVEDILDNKVYQAQLQDGFYRSPRGVEAMTRLRQAFLEYCCEQTNYPSLELTRRPPPDEPSPAAAPTFPVRQKQGKEEPLHDAQYDG